MDFVKYNKGTAAKTNKLTTTDRGCRDSEKIKRELL